MELDDHIKEGDPMTLGGRIKIGMAARGIRTASDLATRLKINRQTVEKWMNNKVKKIEPDLLFPLAKELGLNPEWLMMNKGGPQPGRTISPDDQRVLDMAKAMPRELRDAWVQSGDALLTHSTKPSQAQPFKTSQE